MRARLAALVLPVAGLAYLVLMSVLAYSHASPLIQWAAGVGGGVALIGLVAFDRIRERAAFIRGARAVLRHPKAPPTPRVPSSD